MASTSTTLPLNSPAACGDEGKLRALPWVLAGGLLAATGTWQADLRWLSIDGYTLLFVTALLFLGAGGLLYRRVRRDDGYTTRAAVRGFLNRVAQR